MKNITIFIILLIAFSGYCQTGPGGIGTTDGNSNLKIWLLADDINANGDTQDNPASGTPIDRWSDNSGNLNDFTQSGSLRPTYSSNGNFNSVYYDPNGAQYMNGTITGSYSDGSVFFVINPIDDEYYNTLFNNSKYSLRVEQYENTNKVGYTRYGFKDYKTNIDSPFGIDAIVSYHKSGGSPSINIRVNNTVEWLNVQSTTAGIPFDQLGKVSGGVNRTAGHFYEVILYDGRLNNAEIIIMENYLSAKYDGIPIPYDIYDEDDASNGDYDYEVAGIGRVDASNLHDDSQGTGIVRILNPSNLDDDEFFIWGHDNGILEAEETVDVPSPVQARFVRVWRVSETNLAGSSVDVGSIDIRFDLTDLNSVTASDLRLLVDTDNDGVFADETPISGATALGNNIYQFAGVSAIENNFRFTLGTIDTNQTALPLDLIDFTAKVSDNKRVELTWITSMASGDDLFTVMRSKNSRDWKEYTGNIITKENFQDKLRFHTIDTNPYDGISYYRIKQTGLDGKIIFSPIKKVNITNKGDDIRLYPNPASDKLIIEGNNSDLKDIRIYDSSGHDVTAQVYIYSKNNSRILMDISGLSTGVFFIKTGKSTKRFYKVLSYMY